jgi:hypothetical protein
VLTDKGREILDEATPAFTVAFNRYFASQLAGHYGELSAILGPMATQLEPMPPPH